MAESKPIMMKPSLAKGTRDFAPEEVYRRRYIIDTIRKNFELFGYQPLETPSFENLSTLTGKYGEEGDRLIFKILNSGDFLDKVSGEELQDKNTRQLTPKISDKALRYDLTVPFARFVAMHHGSLPFPYKRYQIQPVWRADRPQKGRYREFYQCDADVVGSTSLWQEVELVSLYNKTFQDLSVPVTVHLNHRKILSALADFAGISDKLIDFTVALDKLDKIGREGVVQELQNKNISELAIEKLSFLFEPQGSAQEIFSALREKFRNNENGLQGVAELEFVFEKCCALGISSDSLKFDITLARGLDYYTGAIFEVKARGVEMGSVGGGGRYDNLTEVFGVRNVPGIGISFGLDRIYLVMEALGAFTASLGKTVQYLFVNFGEEESVQASLLIAKLRSQDISAELYPEAAKMKKQISYAERAGIIHVVFYGAEEIAAGTVVLKNIITGEQQILPVKSLL